MLLEKDIALFFDNAGSGYEDSRYKYMRELRGRAIRSELSGQLVLDVGCNCGQLIQEYNNGEYVVAVDLSLGSLFEAKKIANVHYVNASASALPVKQEMFDSVICSETLYYLQNPLQFLADTRHSLKLGGKLIIVNSNKLYFRVGKLFGPLLGLTPEDINEKTYSAHEVEQMLVQSGFKGVKTKGFGIVPLKGFEFLERNIFKGLGFVLLICGYK